ncbi:esterase [Roseateles sp. DAIF2]|uniref:SGNH/GDSL hydrolase family protein n=1 Tax=Roseateles sp. DAIF2 TaxID=2714952 RepID=UPI0018A2999B|nr:SGNH/GDSL hydrolase family protein [Roseateles sp. DAIF2]QPF72305.1 esterase [Roseateles sp. DAIF2]
MKFLKQGALALAAAAVLAGCGGGGGQIEPFSPKSILVFGDESSVITAEGRKYSVNALDDKGVLDCASNPIWVQSLAGAFGLVFPECNPKGGVTTTGKIYAKPAAKVADVKIQVDGAFNAGGFNSKVLNTVMAGTNDLLELYGQYPQQGVDALKGQARQRGRDLADQVNRIANADGRVLVALLPDLGLTPFALKERANKPDTDRAALLSALTSEFNLELRTNVVNDGRRIALVLMNEESERIGRISGYAAAVGIENYTDVACLDSSLPLQCTAKTLVTNGKATTWLWASPTLMGPVGHNRLGNMAVTRASNNPF